MSELGRREKKSWRETLLGVLAAWNRNQVWKILTAIGVIWIVSGTALHFAERGTNPAFGKYRLHMRKAGADEVVAAAARIASQRRPQSWEGAPSIRRGQCSRVECPMIPHLSRSNRGLAVVALTLVLAATLASCGRGADAPPTGSAAAAPAPAPATPPPPSAPPRELTWSGKVDMQLRSPNRVKAYKVALRQASPPTLAILRIPQLKLEEPVYDGTADAVLDLAAGRIEGTALPGTTGNVGIAAHRDGFFRVLKDVKEGDALVLDTPVATKQNRIEWRCLRPDARLPDARQHFVASAQSVLAPRDDRARTSAARAWPASERSSRIAPVRWRFPWQSLSHARALPSGRPRP
jgi:Sortase domain